MRLTGSQILIRVLLEQGVDTIFGYPGATVLDIYDTLYDHAHEITHVLTAHEQGAAHAADGYARATGKVGVVFATSGPGATNLVTGIATAYLDSVPVVAITGNVACAQIGRDAFQEVDITGVTMPVTKHNFFVNKVSKLADTVREAFRIAQSDRPGPVLVDIPRDIQSAVCEYTPAPAVQLRAAQPVDREAAAAAAARLAQAARPCLYVGGGVVTAEAGQAALALAEKLDAVITSSLMGIGAVPDDAPRYLGMQGMHGRYAADRAMSRADVVVALGARFSDRATGNKDRFCPDADIIHIDVDPAEIDKNVEAAIGLTGDVRQILETLTESVEEKRLPDWQAEIGRYRAEGERLGSGGADAPKALIDAVNRIKTDDTPVVTDVGQHQMWTAQFARILKPRTFLSSGGLGTMGFGMGAAIGASIATGKRAVLITGDGCFGMNLNELATAVRYGVPLTVVLMRNGTLGLVRQSQTLFFGGRYSATTLDRQTDFVKLAEAFGATGARCTDAASFERALADSFASDGVWVLDCPIAPDALVLPMIPPGGSVSDIITAVDVED